MFERLGEEWERRRAHLGADMEADSIYFRRRASEERVAAMKSLHLQARQSHLDLAARYDGLADAILKRNYDRGLDLFGKG